LIRQVSLRYSPHFHDFFNVIWCRNLSNTIPFDQVKLEGWLRINLNLMSCDLHTSTINIIVRMWNTSRDICNSSSVVLFYRILSMVRDIKTQWLYGLSASYLWKFDALRFGDRVVPGFSMMFPNQILLHDNYLILIKLGLQSDYLI
jgi:hypothetical protein